MKVYVDELPKSCAKCELCSHIFTNCLPELYKCAVDGHARFADYKVEDEEPCPLQSLADYTNQVRKEVCERLDKIIEKYLCKKGRYRESLDISSIIKQVMKENLDQIQGEDINA